MTKKKNAKNTKDSLEKKIANIIINNLKNGITLVDACRKVEITKPTFYSYLDKYDLRSKYEAAKITIIDDAHDTIARAVKVDPKYALEVLKRRRSKQWGDKKELKHNGGGFIPFGEIIISDITEEDIETMKKQNPKIFLDGKETDDDD